MSTYRLNPHHAAVKALKPGQKLQVCKQAMSLDDVVEGDKFAPHAEPPPKGGFPLLIKAGGSVTGGPSNGSRAPQPTQGFRGQHIEMDGDIGDGSPDEPIPDMGAPVVQPAPVEVIDDKRADAVVSALVEGKGAVPADFKAPPPDPSMGLLGASAGPGAVGLQTGIEEEARMREEQNSVVRHVNEQVLGGGQGQQGGQRRRQRS